MPCGGRPPQQTSRYTTIHPEYIAGLKIAKEFTGIDRVVATEAFMRRRVTMAVLLLG